MKGRNLAILAVLCLMSIFVIGATVTFLSNTASVPVEVKSPINLTVAYTIDEQGNPIDLATTPLYGGETVDIVLNAQNLSKVNQTGTYHLVLSPAMETDNVSLDEVTVGSGEVSELDLATTTIPANSTEIKTVSITVDSAAEPQIYDIDMVYNVNPSD